MIKYFILQQVTVQYCLINSIKLDYEIYGMYLTRKASFLCPMKWSETDPYQIRKLLDRESTA